MSITDVITGLGQRKLTEGEVEAIIRNNAPHFSYIGCNLIQTLPSLVDYTLGLAQERKQTYRLSEFYPRELQTRDGSSILNYNVGYICDKNGISRVAFDPSSDAMDPGESYMKQIPAQEFLGWVMNNRVRMIDVYQHVEAALRQKKGNGDAHRRHFEAYL